MAWHGIGNNNCGEWSLDVVEAFSSYPYMESWGDQPQPTDHPTLITILLLPSTKKTVDVSSIGRGKLN